MWSVNPKYVAIVQPAKSWVKYLPKKRNKKIEISYTYTPLIHLVTNNFQYAISN